jgi:hypothetical protein
MADVRLEDDRVWVDASDLLLAHSARLSRDIPGDRRALVHDFDDALALNYVGDYPSGVRIFGLVSVERLKIQEGLVVSATALEGVPTIRPEFESIASGLETSLGERLFGERARETTDADRTVDVDRLVSSIFSLQRQVAELIGRVEALEAA